MISPSTKTIIIFRRTRGFFLRTSMLELLGQTIALLDVVGHGTAQCCRLRGVSLASRRGDEGYLRNLPIKLWPGTIPPLRHAILPLHLLQIECDLHPVHQNRALVDSSAPVRRDLRTTSYTASPGQGHPCGDEAGTPSSLPWPNRVPASVTRACWL